MKKLVLAVVLVVAGVVAVGGLANKLHDGPVASPARVHSPAATPTPSVSLYVGVLNPDVTQATIAKTVCVKGWTATVRPPAAWTTALKVRQLGPGKDPKLYEEDHIMPLELGGAPKDPANLRPVLWARASKDDFQENALHAQLCSGKITLGEARTAMSQLKADEG